MWSCLDPHTGWGKRILLVSPPSVTQNAFLRLSDVCAMELPSCSQPHPRSLVSLPTVTLCSGTSGKAGPPPPRFQQPHSVASLAPVLLPPRFRGHIPGSIFWGRVGDSQGLWLKEMRPWCDGPGL